MIWALVAAAAAAWASRLWVPSRPAPLHTTTVDMGTSPRADLSRLFGAGAEPQVDAVLASADSRYRLIGVAAPRSTGEGLALIAIDGKPARAFRVGASVDGDVILQEVRNRGASLGPRGQAATVALEIPPLPAAATGTVPPSQGGPTPASAQPPGLPPPPPAEAVPGTQPQT